MDIKCPHCGTEYEVEKKDFGKYVTCESCGKGFVVGTTTRGKSNGYSGSYPGSQQKPQYEREAGQQHASGGGNKALIAIIVILLVITSSAVTYIFWERKRNWTTRGFVSNQSTGPINNNDNNKAEGTHNGQVNRSLPNRKWLICSNVPPSRWPSILDEIRNKIREPLRNKNKDEAYLIAWTVFRENEIFTHLPKTDYELEDFMNSDELAYEILEANAKARINYGYKKRYGVDLFKESEMSYR